MCIFTELILIINNTVYDKKKTLSVERQSGTIRLFAAVTDENGNLIDISSLSRLFEKKFPLLFTQNELLEACAKEIFMHQRFWRQVQEKRLEDCNKMERIFKQMPHAPSCSDMATRLLDSFEMRSERSPSHTIAYKTCLAKLESMVKTHWDEWRLKHPKSSF